MAAALIKQLTQSAYAPKVVVIAPRGLEVFSGASRAWPRSVGAFMWPV